jgi:uncharacterized cupredoxin-like copper-binding protein
MKILLLTTTLAMSFAVPVFAAGTHAGGHGHDEMAIGKPGGHEHDFSRTVTVTMMETDDGMVFEPGALEFEAGESVKIVVVNAGELPHEFVMDTSENNVEHKALMERFPEMEHDDPNSISLEPGQEGEILWTFANAGSFQFACLIPGHYESGMHGPIAVN